MALNRNPRLLALLEAIGVTFLWSTSYILIEKGLEEINPFAFATYRYGLASSILVPMMIYRNRSALRNLDRRDIAVFLALGVFGYFIAQGLQFVGLYYLHPVTVTLILNLTPVFVLLLSAVFLQEIPSSSQILGIAITLGGVLVFFSDSIQVIEELTGLLTTLVSSIGWATYMVISRFYLRDRKETVVVMTANSMAFGAVLLLGATILTGNMTRVSIHGWILIGWLSLVNTALAFVLWNHALQSLRVYEQSILQNTMLIQIAVLAYVFLNETLVFREVAGMALVFIGVLIVQLKGRERAPTSRNTKRNE
ncbi:MAG: EamA family transporter [Candidatus Bathyarchaeota archaeon]|nr:MAG: EamA family transporter [Candidatus Bathyarchaeota archaeon]